MNAGKGGNYFPALVFAAWAAVFAWLALTKNYQAFLMAPFGFLMVAGAVLSGIFAGILALKPAASPGAGHGLVLLVPLLFLAANHQQSLGSYALEKRMVEISPESRAVARVTPTPVTPPPGYGGFTVVPRERDERIHRVTLLELMHDQETLMDHRVVVQGMAHRTERMLPSQMMVFRFMVTCCVADSKPLALMVQADAPLDLKDDQWVEVDGVLTLEDRPGTKRYIIRADRVRLIDAPPVNEQYLYLY